MQGFAIIIKDIREKKIGMYLKNIKGKYYIGFGKKDLPIGKSFFGKIHTFTITMKGNTATLYVDYKRKITVPLDKYYAYHAGRPLNMKEPYRNDLTNKGGFAVGDLQSTLQKKVRVKARIYSILYAVDGAFAPSTQTISGRVIGDGEAGFNWPQGSKFLTGVLVSLIIIFSVMSLTKSSVTVMKKKPKKKVRKKKKKSVKKRVKKKKGRKKTQKTRQKRKKKR